MQSIRRVVLWLIALGFATSLSGVGQTVIATVPVSDGPFAAAVNSVTNTTYVLNSCGNDSSCQSDGTVTVIDGATLATHTVTVGYQPYFLAVNSVTNKIYVANACGNDSTCQSYGTVTVIDGATLATATVVVGYQPLYLAVNSVTDRIYTSNSCGASHGDLSCSSDDPPGSMTVIDGTTLSTTTVRLGIFPLGVAVNPVTNKIYVVNNGGDEPCCSLNGTLAVIDGVTLSTQSVPADMLPEAVAVNLATNKIYVSNDCGSQGCHYNGSVTVVDGYTLSTQTVGVGNRSRLISVNPVTNKIYVGNRCADSSCATNPTATVIDGLTLATSTVTVCSNPTDHPADVEVNTIANTIYLPCVGTTGHVVTAMDGATNATTTVAVGNTPLAAAVNATTNRVYVPNFRDNTVSIISGANPAPLQFIPITPCRAVDTRPQYGGGGPVHGGTFQSFSISGSAPCGIPSSAAAYSMNVTVVPKGTLGYLTLWPTGQPQPLASTLNSIDGRVKANAAIMPAGTGGQVSVYATNTTDVILDIAGYFAPPSLSTLAFYPLAPCRVADTRKSDFPNGLGPPSLTGGQERVFPILNASTACNIPTTAQAYSLNLTVVPQGSLGYLTVWPTGQLQPTVSTLNDVLGHVIANAAIVVGDSSGQISAYATSNTDLVIDINGYFAPAGTGGLSLYGVSPCRVIDTRRIGSGQPFVGTLSPPVDVWGAGCAASSLAQAYVFNASVVPVGSLGYLTLWPDGQTQPTVSTLNSVDGLITSNMAIVPTTNGLVDAFVTGYTQLFLDISSYFAP